MAGTILLIILIILVIGLVVLYFLGKKAQKKQEAQQEQMEAAKQTISMLIIDKSGCLLNNPVFRRWSLTRRRS